ncbi:MAG: hypothetical protein V4579_04375 [Pseudomonadota bacterium]
MRTWAYLLGGLVVWTVHFFGLYIFGSVFPQTTLARILSGLLTLAALAADAILLWRAGTASMAQAGREELGRWTDYLAALSAAISLIAVFWQGLPVLIA